MKQIQLTRAECRWLTKLLQGITMGSGYVYRGVITKRIANRLLDKLSLIERAAPAGEQYRRAAPQ